MDKFKWMNSSWYCLIIVSFLAIGTAFSPGYLLDASSVTSGERRYTWGSNTGSQDLTDVASGMNRGKSSDILPVEGLKFCSSLRQIKLNFIKPDGQSLAPVNCSFIMNLKSRVLNVISSKSIIETGFFSHYLFLFNPF